MAEKPRVLRILNRLNIGGPTFNASLLTKYLEPEFETHFLSGMIDSTEESSDYVPHALGLQPVYVKDMRREISLMKDYKAYQEIVSHIKKFKPHIVHTHASKAGALGRLAAANHNVPVIVHTFHGNVLQSYFKSWQNTVFTNIERYLAKKSSTVIAISEKQKLQLVNEFKITAANKVQVINLGFDLAKFSDDQERKRKEFRTKYGIADDEIIVGIVARFVPVKNLPMFLQVARNVLDRTKKNVRFVVVGDGEERQKFENLAGQLNLSMVADHFKDSKANIILTSWIKEMDYVYAGFDIVTLTSLNEGTPVSLIEAQVANKPIVTTDVGGVAEVTVSGETAFLCKSGDVAAFTESVLLLTENEPLRKSMGKGGRDHAYSRFNYTRLVEETSQLYWRLLNGHAKHL